jgi:hypothetical protein
MPQLNTIEEEFSMVKARYCALRPRPANVQELKAAIEKILDQLRVYFFQPFYN